MSFPLPFSVKLLNPLYADFWKGPYYGSDETNAKAIANAAIPSGIRILGRDVVLVYGGSAYMYWYKNGVTDSDLIAQEATVVTETDPTVPSYVKSITTTDISNWDTAFSWGNPSGVYIPLSQKGAVSGVAPLNASSKIDEIYLPDSVLGQVEYQGLYNAATNTPTLPTAATANKGWYYIVTAAGTVGSITYDIGDWIISDGAAWGKVDNTDAIASFNGRTGAIILTSTDVTDALTYIPVTNTRTLTINGTGYDLSANRSWTVGDVRTDGSYANPAWITALAWSKISATPTTISGYGITNAYTKTEIDNFFAGTVAITGYNSTNWNSAYTNRITSLTTTGSSGAATLVANVLNIPTYTLAGLGGESPLTFSTGLTRTGNTITNNITQYTDAQARAAQNTASTSVTGLLTSTDWNTFNGKQAALNGTGFVKISGTTISYDNSTYATTASLGSYLPLAGGTLTGGLSGTTGNFSGVVSGFTGAFNNGSFNNSTNATNDLLFAANSGTTDSYIGSGFGALFIQNNNFYNGSTYSFPNAALPSSTISLSGGGFAFQTGAAGVAPSTKISIDNAGLLTTLGISATTATFSGQVTSTATSGNVLQNTVGTTNQIPIVFQNTSGGMSLGVENSTGNGIVGSGGTAYSTVFGSFANRDLHLFTNGIVRFSIASTGAITASSSVTATNYIANGASAGYNIFGKGGLYMYKTVAGSGTDESVGVASESGFYIATGGASTKKITIDNSGAITASSSLYVAGYITAPAGGGTSDLRVKNIHETDAKRSVLDMLHLRKYNQAENVQLNTKFDERVRWGFATDDIRNAYPELIFNLGATDKAESLNYVDLHNMAIIELRDTKAEKTELELLRQKVSELEAQLKSRA